MSFEAAPHAQPRSSYVDADLETLLGLYHGYDQARLALARLVTQFGSEEASEAETRRQIWARSQRRGHCSDLFDPPIDLPAGSHSTQGVIRGAHSAALTAFATMSDKAEELLRALRYRWPELCEDSGGPLPAPTPGWAELEPEA